MEDQNDTEFDPNTKQGRKTLIIEMYYAGSLCNCDTIERVSNFSTGESEKEIRHKALCEGRVKAQLMLDEENQRID